PPISPLFPYTTLFRSGELIRAVGGIGESCEQRVRVIRIPGRSTRAVRERHVPGRIVCVGERRRWQRVGSDGRASGSEHVVRVVRSEEHTSELQSLTNL